MPVYLDDKRVCQQILAGDENAFECFFRDNFARLYRFAEPRLGMDKEAARDVVQTTLTKAMRSMHTYRAESAMFTWLCAICRNEISDWLKREGQFEKHIVLVEDLPEVAAALDSWPAAAPLDPEGQMQRTESLRLIQVALDRLPPRYGDVLEWKYIQGHSVRDIAERLGIGREAAQSLIARAKRAFADVYTALQCAAATPTG